jgi:hypothetical protein
MELGFQGIPEDTFPTRSNPAMQVFPKTMLPKPSIHPDMNSR